MGPHEPVLLPLPSLCAGEHHVGPQGAWGVGGGGRKQSEDSEIIKRGVTFSELQERAVWKWGLDSLANEAAA